MAPRSGATMVIGIGNPDRGDDAAGREAARRLRRKIGGVVEVVELDGEATALLARLEHAQTAFLIDACVSGAAPGTVRRLDVASGPLPPAAVGLSSHGFGLAEALELATALGQLPPRCIVYAIEAQSFDIGAPLSQSVTQAVDVVVARLQAELSGDAQREMKRDA